MSQSGPSREELENYFKNSRAYFDELAKHYYETDREYYDKNIAPFYSPFGSIAPGKSASRLILLIAVLLVAVAGAAVAFFLSMDPGNDSSEEQKRIEDVKEKIQKDVDNKKISKDTTSFRRKTLSNYEKGLESYKLEDYTGAERYFKRVPESDENYNDAQEKLEEIKELKKTGKDNRYIRPSPKERQR